MGKIMIINGSPRAVKSNSKLYAEIFMKHCKSETEYFNITRTNHEKLCSETNRFSDVLLVFPLYADGVPVTLMHFLKALENSNQQNKPKISVLINCGFIEHCQNDTAVRMIRLFCKQNGYEFGSVLKIGSGEAILTTPFKIFAESKIKRLSFAISKGKNVSLCVTMPISKNMFLKASTKYWVEYGRKNGITKEDMDTMKIE